jgi:hypothetical protein
MNDLHTTWASPANDNPTAPFPNPATTISAATETTG